MNSCNRKLEELFFLGQQPEGNIPPENIQYSFIWEKMCGTRTHLQTNNKLK